MLNILRMRETANRVVALRLVDESGAELPDIDLQVNRQSGLISLVVLSKAGFEALGGHARGDLDIAIRRIVFGCLETVDSIQISGEITQRLRGALTITVSPTLLEWSLPFTAVEFARALEERAEAHGFVLAKVGASTDRLSGDSATVVLVAGVWCEDAEPIGPWVSREVARAATLVRDALDTFATKQSSESLVALFDFPVEVRAVCEQYLIFFVDFLKTIGLEATSEIRHQSGQTIFSVTPRDGREALELVSDALRSYLDLPSKPIIEDSSLSIAEQRLAAQVLHTKAQLMLARAELQATVLMVEAQHRALQASDATIKAQAQEIESLHRNLRVLDSILSIKDHIIDKYKEEHERQRGLAGAHSAMQPLLVQTTEEGRPESLAGGVVVMKTYNAFGVDFNLGELVRQLRIAVEELRGESKGDQRAETNDQD